jgi:Protein of unknown function (DUF4230)
MRSDADQDTAQRTGKADRSAAEPVRVTVRSPGGPLRLALAALAAAVALAVALVAAGRLFDWNPFGTTDRDRSGPVVLTALRDLSEYHAASGTYQIVVDLEQDSRYVPDVLKGKRTLFLAIGSVDAFVDFGKLGDKSVWVSDDRRTVRLSLPHAQLAKPAVDANESRVLDRNLGLIDRLGNLFGNNADPQIQQVYALAAQKLGDAARDGRLTTRAEANTRSTLERMLHALGFTTVTIDFGGGEAVS